MASIAFKIDSYTLIDKANSNAIYTTNSYQMDENRLYEEWEDAAGGVHRDYYRTQINGSLEVVIKSGTEYSNFLEAISYTGEGLHEITATITNTGALKTFSAYVKVSAALRVSPMGDEVYYIVDLEVTEA